MGRLCPSQLVNHRDGKINSKKICKLRVMSISQPDEIISKKIHNYAFYNECVPIGFLLSVNN